MTYVSGPLSVFEVGGRMLEPSQTKSERAEREEEGDIDWRKGDGDDMSAAAAAAAVTVKEKENADENAAQTGAQSSGSDGQPRSPLEEGQCARWRMKAASPTGMPRKKKKKRRRFSVKVISFLPRSRGSGSDRSMASTSGFGSGSGSGEEPRNAAGSGSSLASPLRCVEDRTAGDSVLGASCYLTAIEEGEENKPSAKNRLLEIVSRDRQDNASSTGAAAASDSNANSVKNARKVHGDADADADADAEGKPKPAATGHKTKVSDKLSSGREEDGGREGRVENEREGKITRAEEKQGGEEVQMSSAAASEKPNNLFVRGSSQLVSSVRSSLRKIGRWKSAMSSSSSSPPQVEPPMSSSNSPSSATPAVTVAKGERHREVTLTDIEKNKTTLVAGVRGVPGEGEGYCNESQDSGLGEDSELTSPRSPTPATTSGGSSTIGGTGGGIIRPSSLSLRKSSSGCSSSKKHVIIREPSLTNLPSSLSGRQRLRGNSQRRGVVLVHQAASTPTSAQEQQQQRRLATVHIYSRACRLPAPASTSGRPGSVSSQWSQLYQVAHADVVRHIGACDSYTLRLLFDPDKAHVRRELGDLDSVDDISLLIHTVYKVLFHDWLNRSSLSSLSLVVHCVQNFLVVVVDVASDLSAADRRRLAATCHTLLLECEATRYQDLADCLERTRTVYVDIWCTLLCLPFSRSSSPSLSEIQYTLNELRLCRGLDKQQQAGPADNPLVVYV